MQCTACIQQECVKHARLNLQVWGKRQGIRGGPFSANTSPPPAGAQPCAEALSETGEGGQGG